MRSVPPAITWALPLARAAAGFGYGLGVYVCKFIHLTILLCLTQGFQYLVGLAAPCSESIHLPVALKMAQWIAEYW